jgi:hypothetical protein
MNTYYTDAKIEKLEQENARLREVVKMQDEYTSLLVSELEEVILLAATHGWKSHNFEEGKRLREAIRAGKEALK